MTMSEEMMREINLKIGTRLKLFKIRDLLKPSTSTTSSATFSSNNEPIVDTTHLEPNLDSPSIELDVIDLFKKKKKYPSDRNLEDLFLKDEESVRILNKLKKPQELNQTELCIFTDIVVKDLLDVTGEE